MNTSKYMSFVLAVLLTSVMTPVSSWAAGPPSHARVAFESGGAMIRGTQDADWSNATLNALLLKGDTLWVDSEGALEIEHPGASFLRMADQSKAEVAEPAAPALVRAWAGSFYVQRLTRASLPYYFETPSCTVDIAADSLVRIDVVKDGATTISVRWGEAEVRVPDSQPVSLGEGERVYVDPGYLPSRPMRYDRTEQDAFDDWNQDRVNLLAFGSEGTPREVMSGAVMGANDLAPYGEWVTIESRPFWRPTVVVDYIPYRTGYWSYVPGIGYNWIGSYPFSYVTSHYGRWNHNNTYGWVWGYTDTWGPAWCATVRMGQRYVWTPLDFYDRPSQYGSVTFSVGGAGWSMTATTSCLADDLMMGPAICRPVIPQYVNVQQNNITIWNIYNNNYIHDNDHQSRMRRNYAPSMDVRDYEPRRVIRGPMDNPSWTRARAVLPGDMPANERDRDPRRSIRFEAPDSSAKGDASQNARARVVRLEGSMGRARFSGVKPGENNKQTPTQQRTRSAQTRNAAIAPITARETRETARWTSERPERDATETRASSGATRPDRSRGATPDGNPRRDDNAASANTASTDRGRSTERRFTTRQPAVESRGEERAATPERGERADSPRAAGETSREGRQTKPEATAPYRSREEGRATAPAQSSRTSASRSRVSSGNPSRGSGDGLKPPNATPVPRGREQSQPTVTPAPRGSERSGATTQPRGRQQSSDLVAPREREQSPERRVTPTPENNGRGERTATLPRPDRVNHPAVEAPVRPQTREGASRERVQQPPAQSAPRQPSMPQAPQPRPAPQERIQTPSPERFQAPVNRDSRSSGRTEQPVLPGVRGRQPENETPRMVAPPAVKPPEVKKPVAEQNPGQRGQQNAQPGPTRSNASSTRQGATSRGRSGQTR